MKTIRSVFAILLLLAISGCAVSTPQAPVRPAVSPMRRADTEKIRARCAKMRTALAPLEIRGIGLSHRAFDFGYTPGTICGFVAGAGFNRVYFNISSESELDEKLTEFLTAARQRNLTVVIFIRQDNFHPRAKGNRVIRDLRDACQDLPSAVRRIREYNQNLPQTAGRIKAVTVLAEPHRFTAHHPGTQQIFAWNDKSFGPGMDNDLLMKETFAMLGRIDPGELELTVAFPDFYHELAAEGKVTTGKLQDFSAVNPQTARLMIMSAGNKPSRVASGLANELAAAGKGQRIVLGIPLSGHTADSGSSLRRRNFGDLIRVLDFIVKKYRNDPAFKGIMITPLSVLEFLIMEQD